MTARPISIVLCEDHSLVRAGLRALLDSIPDVQVVGEAGRGDEGLAIIEASVPDVALVDVAMPGINGLKLASLVASRFPQTRVLIVSIHNNDAYVREALAAGARGYLLKDADPGELAAAVRTVARGDTYPSPGVGAALGRRAADRPGGMGVDLSPRQREILQYIAQGSTTKEIAARLGLSVKTVETHRTELMRRLDIHDVAGLVRYAIRTGLITADD